MSEITPISTDETPELARLTHVRCIQADRKFIWGQLSDGSVTTISWYNRHALARDGGWDRGETQDWEYGPVETGGFVYELPWPIAVTWESVDSQNGHEYKRVTSAVKAIGAPVITSGKAIATPDLPATAREAQDRLELLAPKLKAAKLAAETAAQARKAAKDAVLQAFERDNFMLLDAENKANERKAELDAEARQLLKAVADTGAQGHVLNGWYQINQSTEMVAKSEGELIGYLVENRALWRFLRVDMDALSGELNGKKSGLHPDMPVRWETTSKPVINWSKLPAGSFDEGTAGTVEPPEDELATLKALNAGEGAVK